MDYEMQTQIENLLSTMGIVAIFMGAFFIVLLFFHIIQIIYDIKESQAITRYYNKIYIELCNKSKK